MSDSIVDLGAAGEYISEKFEDVVDYFTGAPEARAGSRGFFKDLGPGVRQYYLGPGEEEGESFFEYLGFEDGGIVELGEGSPMSMATKEELEEFLEFLRKNRPSFKEGETEQYLEFGEILGMQQVDPKSKVTVDGVVVQQPPIPPSFAGRRMDREEFYEGFAEPSRQITDEETQERRGITQKDIAEGRIRLRDLESAYSLGDPYAGELGAFVPRRIEIGPDGKEFESPVGFEKGGGIGGLMQMSTQTRLNDRDDAVGTKLMRQAGMQASANQVMDNLDPKILAQMSRILGRDIG